MSYIMINQDYETNTDPWDLTGSGMTRSATNAITTTSLRGRSGTATANTATFSPGTGTAPTGRAPSGGSRHALMIQWQCLWKPQVLPTTVTPDIIEYRGSVNSDNFRVVVADSGNVLQLWSGDVGAGLPTHTAAGSTALTATTTYDVEVEYRDEEDDGVYARLWLGGALEITARFASKGILDLTTVFRGEATNKGTWEYIWDREMMRICKDAS